MPTRHTVLVVDDEQQVVRSVADLLRMDHRVLGTTSPAEALEMLRREDVHVVMSDQRMPDISGVELLQTVRKERPNVVRLLFTGYADISAVITAINKGNVYRYINKPWNPEEFQATIRDACAHYDLVEERRQLLAELEKRNAELKQSDALKSAFIKVAGHEFRTPVAILIGLCKLALFDESVKGTAREHVEQIDATSERLQLLVNQILAMLSAETFDRVFDAKLADVAPVLEQAAEDVKPFVAMRHQSLNLDISPDVGAVFMDERKVRDSLNHLLLNAVKFTPDHGQIALKSRRENDHVIIEVSDNGTGISPETLPRMFQSFFTAFDVSKHSSGHHEFGTRGLGLGLSVVKAFTEMHGGRVAVESQVGKGSVFSIVLPTRKSEPKAGESLLPGGGQIKTGMPLVAEGLPSR